MPSAGMPPCSWSAGFPTSSPLSILSPRVCSALWGLFLTGIIEHLCWSTIVWMCVIWGTEGPEPHYIFCVLILTLSLFLPYQPYRWRYNHGPGHGHSYFVLPFAYAETVVSHILSLAITVFNPMPTCFLWVTWLFIIIILSTLSPSFPLPFYLLFIYLFFLK